MIMAVKLDRGISAGGNLVPPSVCYAPRIFSTLRSPCVARTQEPPPLSVTRASHGNLSPLSTRDDGVIQVQLGRSPWGQGLVKDKQTSFQAGSTPNRTARRGIGLARHVCLVAARVQPSARGPGTTGN